MHHGTPPPRGLLTISWVCWISILFQRPASSPERCTCAGYVAARSVPTVFSCSIAAFLQLARRKSERSLLQTKPAIAFHQWSLERPRFLRLRVRCLLLNVLSDVHGARNHRNHRFQKSYGNRGILVLEVQWENEDYTVHLSEVGILELIIVPDKSGGDVRASLRSFRVA